MGRLHYGDRPYTFEDRALIHLQVVVGAKLRRMESFFLTWTPTKQGGSGRLSIWLHPGIHLVLEFTDQDASEPPGAGRRPPAGRHVGDQAEHADQSDVHAHSRKVECNRDDRRSREEQRDVDGRTHRQ